MTTVTTELDPFFVKALGYLWSKSPDSTAKLKKMLDDAIEQSQKKKQEAKSNIDKLPIIKPTKHAAKLIKPSESKKKEKDLAQKRQFEKIQKDLEELDHDVAKKSRIDLTASPAFFSSDSKMSPKQSTLNQESGARGSPSTSADDKDFSLDLDGLACVICNVVSNSSGNTPVECQECHNMYHRECHQPPISYHDANDPRCIWYCARCTKTMKKVAKQNNSKSPNAVSSNTMKERMNAFDSKNKSAFVTPFKRNEIKTTIPTSSNGSGGGSLSGWAALSGKNINPGSSAPGKVSSLKTSSQDVPKPVSSANISQKDKKEKVGKISKPGPKLSTSDAWAEALGADLPPAPSGSKASSLKSSLKTSGSWGSGGKSSVFPKVSATSLPGSSSGGKSMTTEANAMKRLQNLKKKAKMKPQKKI